ncbi:MAG: hypothetical protein IPH78_07050 [Bacteroidetes bacterium]|nr:hypothetical protein [Bacteroidota bacterium]
MFAFSEEQWAQIETSAGEKFKSASWVYGRSPFTTIRKKEVAHYCGGRDNASINMGWA